MPLRLTTAALLLPLFLSAVAAAQDPIVKIDIAPNRDIFGAASRTEPLQLESAEAAAEHFGEEELAALNEQVDWDNQIVLIFAWRGSGQDRLTYEILESFPEQVPFQYHPGRTRDLRPHVYVYILRSNVRWTAPR